MDKWLCQAQALGAALSRSMKSHKRYTVRHRMPTSRRVESCYYASDAFEARVLAMESVPFIKAHPNCIEEIRCEDPRPPSLGKQ